jgi:hypothetical protein
MSSPMIIEVTNTQHYIVKNGTLHIEKTGDHYSIEYHNPIYTNSPFKMPTTFSDRYTIEEILQSHELAEFLSRFTRG